MTATVQNHIHLDTIIGGAPEYAPPTKYGVSDRAPEYEVHADFSRAWDGTPHFSSLADSQGNSRFFTNMRYTLRVTPSQLATLRSILLKQVKLVDNEHSVNGTDHRPYTRTMRFMELKYLRFIDPVLTLHEVSILLLDET